MSQIDSFLIQAVSAVPLGSSTSAYLQAMHTRLLHEESKPLNFRQKIDHCGACGSIRKPHWSKVTEVKLKKSKLSASSAPKRATVYKCLRCCKRTVLPRQNSRKPFTKPSPRGATTSTRESTPVGIDVKGSTQASTDIKAVDNQSSKKRAKARKQGGLQALLASKQRAQPSLDLLDFLQ